MQYRLAIGLELVAGIMDAVPRLIVRNGPPGCGKSTMTDVLSVSADPTYPRSHTDTSGKGTEMSEHNTQPSRKMQSLDRLVGSWKVSGGANGSVTYEWLDGRHFLVQRVDFDQDGHRVTGVEMIGHELRFGEEPSEEVKSRFYGNGGETFDYVYELDGDVLTIWGGEKGSPAYFRGTFSADDDVLDGAWHYPGGGGYESTMSRVS